MDKGTAERWVTISALVVIGMYAYRRLVEPAQTGKLKNVIGVGTPVPLGQFATAWGFTFLVVSIMAEAAPGFGGAFAILIATSDFLTNSSSLFADVTQQSSKTVTTTAATTAGAIVPPVIAPVGSFVPMPTDTLSPIFPTAPAPAQSSGSHTLFAAGVPYQPSPPIPPALLRAITAPLPPLPLDAGDPNYYSVPGHRH